MSNGPAATLLSWVKTEIDFSLGVVRETIARVRDDSSDGKVLSVCPHQLHQVTGALRMVGLHGARQFCEAIEGAFAQVTKAGSGKKSLGTIDRSVVALRDFVDGLADGGPNVPLKLYPVYRELAALQGRSETTEKELFYPDLTLPPPAHPEQMTIAADAIAEYAQAQRTRFQRGLVAWMQKRDETRGLRKMRQAVDAMDQICGQLPEPRALWWIAGALVDGLMQPPSPQWLVNVRPLCSRIDFEMRDLAKQSMKPNEALARDLLYAVATCAPVTDRVKAVKALFALDVLLPEPEVGLDFDMEWLQPALADVRSRLEAAKNVWLEYLGGAMQKLPRFRELVKGLKARSDELGSPELVRLFDVIALVSTRLPDPYPPDTQKVMLEMATAFLLAESVIEGFSHPPADLEQQIVLINGWLLDAASGKSHGVPPQGLRPDLVQQFNETQLRNQVAREILHNLHEIEQVLDTFARDPGKPEGLAALNTSVRQIHGAFALLGMARGVEVLACVEDMIAKLVAAPAAYRAEDMDWIAEGVSSLGMFLEPCLRSRAPDASALERFLARATHRVSAAPEDTVPELEMPAAAPDLAAETATPATDTAAAPDVGAPETEPAAAMPPSPVPPVAEAQVEEHIAAAPSQAAIPASVNEELLAVYLEEAHEVLSTIDSTLPQCEAEPQNRDALSVVRRGFHTLKGSGRMVGLTELGEVAWAIEQVMNRWLESRQPATPSLLQLARLGSAGFARWVKALEQRIPFAVDADAILALAERLKTGETAAAPEMAVPVTPDASQEPSPPATTLAEPELVSTESSAVSPPLTEIPTSPAPAIEPAVVEAAREGQVEVRGIPIEPATTEVDYSALKLDFEPLPPEAADATPPAEPPAEYVVMGDIRIPATLYDIYVKEAQGHAAALQREFAAWQAHPGRDMSSEFHRAAHTLASISRTAGIGVIAELAGELEDWTAAAQHAATAEEANLVQQIIGKLTGMVASVAQREAPAAAAELMTALRGIMTRPQSAPAPVHSDSMIIRAAAAAGVEKRVIRDDIDPQLLPIFLDEAQELLPLIGGDLREWKAKPDDTTTLQSLKRTLHTLKGSARMAGAMRLGELTHLMEGHVEAAQEAGQPTAEILAELESQMDRLSADIERLRHREPAAQPDKPATIAPPAAKPKPAAVPAERAPAIAKAASATPARVPLRAPGTMLRISADMLDRLINQAGEASIARTRIEGEVRTLTSSASDLNESIARLRTELRELEIQAESQTQSRLTLMGETRPDFDPLEFDRYTRLQELTRMMTETIHDALTIQQSLVHALDEANAALVHQARINRDLQQELMRLRTVPFSSIVERLYRVVRVSARELGKKANLEIRGEQVEIDRSMLERAGAPLEHLLRNAVAHGIESPEQRTACGKSEIGEITLALRQESDEVVITVSDDGGGLNLEKLRRKGLEMQLLPTDREPTDAEIQQVIFTPGVSTAEEITELAGRGIGMDVVRNEITTVGGRIEIDSKPGRGTTFTIYLPLTLAVAQAVLVRSGEQTFAISSALVNRVLRLKPDGIAALHARGGAEADGENYPIHDLRQLIGSLEAAHTPEGYTPVLLLRSGNQRIAVQVDELLKNQEIVIKNIGPQLARMAWMSGATVLGDGRIVLMINPVQLAQQAHAVAQASAAAQAHAPKTAEHTIMVVDDSLTVRKVTSRLLEREGYRVLAAKDGVDALEQLNHALPDVMLVDIEMPRMDGFDLTRNVRSDPKTAATPIIIISSRTADKHRNHAFELGVNAFIGKPYEEAELLSQIQRCLEKHPHHVH